MSLSAEDIKKLKEASDRAKARAAKISDALKLVAKKNDLK